MISKRALKIGKKDIEQTMYQEIVQMEYRGTVMLALMINIASGTITKHAIQKIPRAFTQQALPNYKRQQHLRVLWCRAKVSMLVTNRLHLPQVKED